MEKITINKGKLLAAYRKANEDQQVILEFLYGKETFQYDWREITSYEKACDVLGIEPIEFKEVGDRPQYMRMANAIQKILVICEAINGNGNWYDDEGRGYHPLLALYTKEDMQSIGEEECKRIGIHRLFSADYANSDNICGVGYHLFCDYTKINCMCFDYAFPMILNSREKAEFVGKRFFELCCACYGLTPIME